MTAGCQTPKRSFGNNGDSPYLEREYGSSKRRRVSVKGILVFGRKIGDDRSRHQYFAADDEDIARKYGDVIVTVPLASCRLLNLNSIETILLLMHVAEKNGKSASDVGIKIVHSDDEVRRALEDDTASGVSILYNEQTQELFRRSVDTDHLFINFLLEHWSEINDELGGEPVKGYYVSLEGHHPECWFVEPINRNEVPVNTGFVTPLPMDQVHTCCDDEDDDDDDDSGLAPRTLFG
jgi:hypothetical protein